MKLEQQALEQHQQRISCFDKNRKHRASAYQADLQLRRMQAQKLERGARALRAVVLAQSWALRVMLALSYSSKTGDCSYCSPDGDSS